MTNDTFLHAIGNTPLSDIFLDQPTNVTLTAKLEYLNPGGSMKDRSALYMISTAERDGKLKPGGTIIDASSGNHGIAVAMIGASKGYKVIISVSEKISKEKLMTLQSYGAHVVMCPATKFIEDPMSYHSIAKRIHANTPGSCMLDQYFNTQNADGHYYSLGAELWNQTQGNITHFFAGAGTGGTISGVGRFLKQRNPSIKIIAVDAATSWRATHGNPQPYVVEGIGVDFKSPVLDLNVIDEFITVSDNETITTLQLLAHRGILVGPSSGSVTTAVRKYMPNFRSGDRAIMIFGDSGRAYLTKNFYPINTITYAHELFQTTAHTTQHTELI